MASRIRLADRARRQYREIISRSVREFGASRANRYADLIDRSIHGVAVEPDRRGSVRHDEITEGLRSIHLRHFGSRVKKPCHLIVYRHAGEFIDILAILHERMDIANRLKVT